MTSPKPSEGIGEANTGALPTFFPPGKEGEGHLQRMLPVSGEVQGAFRKEMEHKRTSL